VVAGVGLDVLERRYIAAVKIRTPDLPVYILVIVLTVVPHTDLNIIEKSLLMKKDGSFGLGFVDS
jgi:hypothetical protein